MDRYERVECGVPEFWEVEVDGRDVWQHHGPDDGEGEWRVLHFTTAKTAVRERNDLARQMVGIGWRLASSTGDAAPRAPRADPLPTRTRPGPPLDAAADRAAFLTLLRPLLDASRAEPRSALDAFRATLAAAPPERVDAEDAGDWAACLPAICPGMGQKGERWRYTGPVRHVEACRDAFTSFARWLAAAGGAPALIAAAAVLRPVPFGYENRIWPSPWSVPAHLGLRAAIVGLPDPDYEAVRAAFEAAHAAAPGAPLAGHFAFLLADDRPSARHGFQPAAVLSGLPQPPHRYDEGRDWLVPLVADLPASAAAAWRANKNFGASLRHTVLTMPEAAATLVAVARSAGEPPAPSLLWLMRDAQGDDRTALAEAVLGTREDDALARLLPHLDEKIARDAVDGAERADPAWVFGRCLLALAARPHAGLAARVAAAVERRGADVARAWAAAAGPRATAQLDRSLASRDVALAPREAWPAVLRDPPWRRRRTAAGVPAEPVALEPIPTPLRHPFTADGVGVDPPRRGRLVDVLADLEQLRGRVAEVEAGVVEGRTAPPRSEPVPAPGADPAEVLAWLDRRLRQEGERWYSLSDGYRALIHGMPWQPEPLALMLWGQTEHVTRSYTAFDRTLALMLIRFGVRAVPGFAAMVELEPVWKLPLAAEVDAAALAPAVARLLQDKRVRRPAALWLRRHPRTAAMRLLPDALGPAGPARDAAEAALRWLAAATPEARAAVDEAVAAYAAQDPRVPAAAAAGLDRHPLERVPARVAKVPAWAAPNAMARPRLREGGALPDEAVTAVVEMLSFSTELAPYAGLAALRDACTADSLDAFARDLCAAWAANGASPRQDWALWATAWLGDAAAARDLVRAIRAWAMDGAKGRALAGLDVLAAVGSDVALTGLAAIAGKNPFKQLRERAATLVDAVAEARGLTAEEMADRVAPDLGLDARGGLDLDFGPRRFRVGFDELLRPWVRDADGQRLKLLPRPNKLDDRERAKAAAARWAGLKKDAEATADLQVSRLEAMLAAQRRVARPVFRRFFAEHPLLRHLAGRLVWGVYEGKGGGIEPRAAFRVTEDLELVDVDEALVELPDGDRPDTDLVGLVHPLHLAGGALERWTALFGDYEILQPFPQLGREVFRLTEAEAAGAEITRFASVKVAGRRLRGMHPQGWPPEQHGESLHALHRDMRGADGRPLTAVLGFSPGLWRDPRGAGDPPQTLDHVTLFDPVHPRVGAAPRFGELDAVAASEMLRGPALLAAAGTE